MSRILIAGNNLPAYARLCLQGCHSSLSKDIQPVCPRLANIVQPQETGSYLLPGARPKLRDFVQEKDL